MSAPRPTPIEIVDFSSSYLTIYQNSSNLGDYNALVTYCFNAFNRNPERFSLHFHFGRLTLCADDELLRENEWNNGVYFHGEGIPFFAHFVARIRGQPGRRLIRRSVSPPDSPPSRPWTQPPLPNVNEQRVLQPVSPPTDEILRPSSPVPASPTPRRVPRQTQPPATVRRPTSQRRNTNSTTVYSLGPPMPSAHYTGPLYFSAPFTFIPLQPAAPRPRTHAQRYTAFPDFGSQAPTPAAAATSAMLAPTAAAVSNPPPASHQPDDRSPPRQPPSRDENDFNLNFGDPPVSRQQSHRQQDQHQDSQQEEDQPSVAPDSAGSGGLFVSEGTGERNFRDDLAWEDEDEEEEDDGIDDTEEGEDDVHVRR
jgi:hypothetical protein